MCWLTSFNFPCSSSISPSIDSSMTVGRLLLRFLIDGRWRGGAEGSWIEELRYDCRARYESSEEVGDEDSEECREL